MPGFLADLPEARSARIIRGNDKFGAKKPTGIKEF